VTRIGKLNERFASGGAISFTEFRRLLEAFGFEHLRTRGSHLIYARGDIADQLSIQPEGKQAKAYQVRQFAAIIAKYRLQLDNPS
jgi:HicA toxin of bacterial toxin-antitoxin,